MSATRGRVLVVEDEAPQRALLEAFLARSGLEVETAPGVVPPRRSSGWFRSSVIVTSTLGFLPGAMSVTVPIVTLRPGQVKST